LKNCFLLVFELENMWRVFATKEKKESTFFNGYLCAFESQVSFVSICLIHVLLKTKVGAKYKKFECGALILSLAALMFLSELSQNVL